ncbi:unnamed protein product [Heterobilharzia americana]|nr:unnamed protein product [Heterobilharzia americana]
MTEELSSVLIGIGACKSLKEATEKFSNVLKSLRQSPDNLLSDITTIANTRCVTSSDMQKWTTGLRSDYKLDIYMRIAEYCLKTHQIHEAEIFVNRASLLQLECQNQQLLIRYKKAYALLLDLKQKFIEAGHRYAELSIRFPCLDDSERLDFLERALAAALLSGASQQRARLLATLYKDERCQTFDAYPVLENMLW